MLMPRQIWISLLLGCYLGTSPGACASNVADQLFQEAATHYQAESWQAAADTFAAYLVEAPAGANVPSALFYQAEARVQLEQHAAAQELFQQYLDQQPSGDQNRARAEFQIAKASWTLTEHPRARTQLSEFVRRYPQHPLAELARDYLAQLAQPADFGGDPLQAADQWLAEGRLELALRSYLRVASLERNSARAHQAWLGSARCYELLGEPAEAEEIRARANQATCAVATEPGHDTRPEY